MKIQFLNGGLANQIFQYIFVRFAELYNSSEDPWLIDDSFFFLNNIHNGYELERVFGIQANLLSRHFDADVWQEFLNNKKNGISIPQTFKNLGFDMQMIAETTNYHAQNPFDGKVIQISPNEFHPEITKFPVDFAYYHGYWIHPDWYRSYKDILKKELTFPAITEQHNLNYAAQITSSRSIGVHIRRGDYVSLGWDIAGSYYYDSMKSLTEKYPDAAFFIFSDDLKWCIDNSSALGFDLASDVTFIEGNTGSSSYRDLQLMSMCRGLLMSNSAFCYFAAMINDDLEICVEPHRS